MVDPRRTQTIDIRSEADTAALGERLAQALPVGSVVSLVGDLGAGKTRLVQSIAGALGTTEEVTSPTFVLLNEYVTGRLPVYHFDAYRLKDEDEFLQLGPEEYFAGMTRAGLGLTFIEWGNLVEQTLPTETITIRIEVLEGQSRKVEISGLELADEE